MSYVSYSLVPNRLTLLAHRESTDLIDVCGKLSLRIRNNSFRDVLDYGVWCRAQALIPFQMTSVRILYVSIHRLTVTVRLIVLEYVRRILYTYLISSLIVTIYRWSFLWSADLGNTVRCILYRVLNNLTLINKTKLI